VPNPYAAGRVTVFLVDHKREASEAYTRVAHTFRVPPAASADGASLGSPQNGGNLPPFLCAKRARFACRWGWVQRVSR